MADQPSAPDVVQIPAADTGWFGKNRAGVLRIAGDRAAFVAGGKVEFDVPVAELRGGRFAAGDSVFKVSINGRKYRFYFGGRAADTPALHDEASVVQGAKGFAESRTAGKTLKQLLGI